MAVKGSYTWADLIKALRDVDIQQGDTVFLHVSLDALGTSPGESTEDLTAALFYSTMRQAVGEAGTLVVPSYTFSFCHQELFDVEKTPSRGGPWSTSANILEYFRQLPGATRSQDPIHSVVAIGPRAKELVTDVPSTCFGEGSVFDRLRRAGGKICTIGVGLREATFRHHAEEALGVPFRYKKLFTGVVRSNGVERKMGWIYYVRILAENGFPDGCRLEQAACTSGIARSARVGDGEITAVRCEDLYELTVQELRKNPWCTAKGPAGDPVRFENNRTGGTALEPVTLSPHASMEEMIEKLWRLPRDIVSDGYDVALKALSGVLPMTVHEYPSGTECWSWIVPEKWTCHEAFLETEDGRRLFSYADHPLHVVSYSLPFEGWVSREELLSHLHTNPRLPDGIPFVFKYYERNWGLCCSERMKASLTESRYRVVIRSEFSYSTLKVGEISVPGATPATIVLCAHLCHPAMVNDDLSGVVVGMKVMEELLARPRMHYTYKFLILPETIGSLAYLSHNEDEIRRMRGGLFLEMLGRNLPHALQLSNAGSTPVDLAFKRALFSGDPQGWASPYRMLMGNDERQFNAPGVRVPMLSLFRIHPPRSPEYPYREYHSSEDSPHTISLEALEGSRQMVLRMIDTLETDRIPRNKYKGEVFCSRYGIHIDAYENPEGNQALFRIMDLVDGQRSLAGIAEECGISLEAVRQTLGELERHGLIEYDA